MIEALKSDEIVNKMGGRFKLTALIQRRLKELIIDGARPLVERDGRTDLEVVIDEILQDKIGPDWSDADYDPGQPEVTEATEADLLRDRRIIVGLSGGIACYKVASVVSALAQAGAEVTVAMTDAATRFVTPLTFQALAGRPVYTSQWTHIESHDPQHVSLARVADLMLIAPCTMDMMARLAGGRTDDVVSLIASAVDLSRQPVLVAPSMNAVMWGQPSTRRNLATLRDDGFRIIEPGTGWQACRTDGIGRLAEPEELLDAVRAAIRG